MDDQSDSTSTDETFDAASTADDSLNEENQSSAELESLAKVIHEPSPPLPSPKLSFGWRIVIIFMQTLAALFLAAGLLAVTVTMIEIGSGDPFIQRSRHATSTVIVAHGWGIGAILAIIFLALSAIQNRMASKLRKRKSRRAN